MRTIRKYGNRKLYDSVDSRYVTLTDLAALVRMGEELRVVDYRTSEDLTAATLAQIIFEEEKLGPRLSREGLLRIIRQGLPAS